MPKPFVFIGSSTNSIEVAQAVRARLESDGEITIWNEGFFTSGSTFIETLTTKVARFDFGIFLFHADDITKVEEQEFNSPRDNVIFELGLFMGHLGRERTFILHQLSDKIKIPSDLSGSTTLTFTWEKPYGNNRPVVGAAADEIRLAIKNLGISPIKANAEISGIRNRQETMEQNIRALQVVTKGLVTKFEYVHLENLAKDGPYIVSFHNGMYSELNRLDAIRFVFPQPGRGLVDIKQHDGNGHEFDLKIYVYITDEGRNYLTLSSNILKDG